MQNSLQDCSLNHFQLNYDTDAVYVGLHVSTYACLCVCVGFGDCLLYPTVIPSMKLKQVWFNLKQWDSTSLCGVLNRGRILCNITKSATQGTDWNHHFLAILEAGQILHYIFEGSCWPARWFKWGYTRGWVWPVNLALMTAVVPLIYTIGLCFGIGVTLGSLTWSALWN